MADLVILVLLGVLVAAGYRRGAIVSALGLIFIGTFGLVAALVGAAVGGPALGFGFGAAAAGGCAVSFSLRAGALQERVREWTGRMHQLDRPAGAVASGMAGLVLVWLVAAVASLVPASGGVLTAVSGSRIGGAVLNVLSPTGTVASVLLRSGFVPALEGPVIVVEAPDENLIGAPSIQRAATSVVKIQGPACGQVTSGTGWVVAERLVVTNAHVVAGHRQTAVFGSREGPHFAATVVAFDARNDIAVLSVPDLALPPLPRRTSLRHGTPGVVIGFPRQFDKSFDAVRIDRVVEYAARDIYDNPAIDTSLVVFRGVVSPGNSGSPIVDAQGYVLATVTAAAIGQRLAGGYGVPEQVVGPIVAGGRLPVSTGACLAGEGPREL